MNKVCTILAIVFFITAFAATYSSGIMLTSEKDSIRFNWIDASNNGNIVSISRYGISISYQLSNPFPYKGENYNYLVISKDGWIGLSKNPFNIETQWSLLSLQPAKDQIEVIITALPFRQTNAKNTDIYLLETK